MKRTQLYYARTAAAILGRISYATLATVTEANEPWNTPVAVVYDRDLTLYWVSDKQAQHSQNVRANGRVFIVVYDSTWPEGSGGQGVYIRAAAHEVHDRPTIQRARQLKHAASDDAHAFMGASVRRVYRAVPERIWINTVERRRGRFVRDYRIELQMAAVQKHLRVILKV